MKAVYFPISVPYILPRKGGGRSVVDGEIPIRNCMTKTSSWSVSRICFLNETSHSTFLVMVESPFARSYYRWYKSNHRILFYFHSIGEHNIQWNNMVPCELGHMCVCVFVFQGSCYFYFINDYRAVYSFVFHQFPTCIQPYIAILRIFFAKWLRIEYELLLFFSLFFSEYERVGSQQ